MPFRIGIRCDQNIRSGFGHFSRCLNLARHLQASGQVEEICFWGDYQAFALQQLAHYQLSVQPLVETAFETVPKAWKTYDYLIVDSYLFEQAYIDRLAREPFQTVFIDDACILDFRAADWVINFRFGAESFPYQARQKLLGPQYFIAKPEFDTIRAQRKNTPVKHTPHVLVFFSGSLNPTEWVKDVLTVISDILPDTPISYIARDFSPFQDKKFAHIRKIPPHPEIEQEYGQASLVINGGGLTKYECGYMLIPSASLAITELQHQDSLILAQWGIITDLGLIPELSPAPFRQSLAHFLTDTVAHQQQQLASQQHFSDQSTTHLVNKLLQINNRKQ